MKVYKAVIQDDRGVYNSAVMRQNWNYGWGLTYEIGKTTVPKQGKVYAFKTLRAAKKWISSGNRWNRRNVAILECETKGISHKVIIEDHRYPSLFHKMWMQYEAVTKSHKSKEKLKNIYNKHVPDGTVMCSSVTPLRVVAFRTEREYMWREEE